MLGRHEIILQIIVHKHENMIFILTMKDVAKLAEQVLPSVCPGRTPHPAHETVDPPFGVFLWSADVQGFHFWSF